LSKGPHGEEPSPASAVSLTSEAVEKVRGFKAKAAIVLHYGGNDWSEAQVAGLKSQFERMGIEVVAVRDAGFNAERQVANIHMVLGLDPNSLSSSRQMPRLQLRLTGKPTNRESSWSSWTTSRGGSGERLRERGFRRQRRKWSRLRAPHGHGIAGERVDWHGLLCG
jgi:hypothetical protein